MQQTPTLTGLTAWHEETYSPLEDLPIGLSFNGFPLASFLLRKDTTRFKVFKAVSAERGQLSRLCASSEVQTPEPTGCEDG